MQTQLALMAIKHDKPRNLSIYKMDTRGNLPDLSIYKKKPPFLLIDKNVGGDPPENLSIYKNGGFLMDQRLSIDKFVALFFTISLCDAVSGPAHDVLRSCTAQELNS